MPVSACLVVAPEVLRREYAGGLQSDGGVLRLERVPDLSRFRAGDDPERSIFYNTRPPRARTVRFQFRQKAGFFHMPTYSLPEDVSLMLLWRILRGCGVLIKQQEYDDDEQHLRGGAAGPHKRLCEYFIDFRATQSKHVDQRN